MVHQLEAFHYFKTCLKTVFQIKIRLRLVPLISPRSSLEFNLSIFSFQSLESSFSMQDESVGGEKRNN